MADYKRMVSYMYQYENGVKRKNVGYARIEARNGQCKITLHMQLLGQSDSIFPTYLIQRDDNNLDLVYLGDAVLKGQVMDSRLNADEKNMMGSGFGLSDMGGILLFLNETIFFATEWDDRPIKVDEVMEALKPKKLVNEPEKLSVTEDLSEAISPEGFSLAEEIRMPKYKLPRGWKTIERQHQPMAAEVSSLDNQALSLDSGNMATSENTDEDMKDDYDEDIEDKMEDGIEDRLEERDEERIEQVMSLEEENPKEENPKEENPEEEIRDQLENPTAQHFFDHFPRIYPFEDNEIILCVKIEPKDIGMLPKELWALSNNSFLMHGYYCYHHLIFAKMKDRYGCRYILGIPGIYHNRERFMARMFGLEEFKSIRRRELKLGDFGYWYMTVNF